MYQNLILNWFNICKSLFLGTTVHHCEAILSDPNSSGQINLYTSIR